MRGGLCANLIAFVAGLVSRHVRASHAILRSSCWSERRLSRHSLGFLCNSNNLCSCNKLSPRATPLQCTRQPMRSLTTESSPHQFFLFLSLSPVLSSLPSNKSRLRTVLVSGTGLCSASGLSASSTLLTSRLRLLHVNTRPLCFMHLVGP